MLSTICISTPYKRYLIQWKLSLTGAHQHTVCVLGAWHDYLRSGESNSFSWCPCGLCHYGLLGELLDKILERSIEIGYTQGQKSHQHVREDDMKALAKLSFFSISSRLMSAPGARGYFMTVKSSTSPMNALVPEAMTSFTPGGAVMPVYNIWVRFCVVHGESRRMQYYMHKSFDAFGTWWWRGLETIQGSRDVAEDRGLKMVTMKWLAGI